MNITLANPTATPKIFDTVGMIMDYEAGEMELPEIVNFFSHLVKTGMAWTLQGSYGRTAMTLIEAGYLTKDGDITEEGSKAFLTD